LIGVVLGLKAIPEVRNEAARQLLAATGLALIATAVFAFSESTAFPGVAALVPCLGAACIIHARTGDGIIGRLISIRPLVFASLISYSLYLWHWPIIVFTRYVTGHELTPLLRGSVVLASVAVAAASWRFIERPFCRRREWLAGKPLAAGAIALVTVTAGMGGLVVLSGGLPGRLPDAAQAIYAATYDRSHFYQQGCFTESDRKGPPMPTSKAARSAPWVLWTISARISSSGVILTQPRWLPRSTPPPRPRDSAGCLPATLPALR